MIKFGVIGTGWRAEFFIRIAKLIPDKFEITSLLTRDKTKNDFIQKEYGLKAVNSLDEMMLDNPDFVVVSIKKGFITPLLLELFEKGIPVLCETPPGESVSDLENLWNEYTKFNAKVQIAEQYIYQPLYASWYNAINKGLLGEVENINISSLHGYHGASIIRKFLNAPFNNFVVYGKEHIFNVQQTMGREGIVQDGQIGSYSRKRLTVEFDNLKTAFFDFADSQYHSFIRTRHLNVQGTRGEIDDLTIRYLSSKNVPVTQNINRIDMGVYNNKEWSHLGIMLGEEFLYKSPFVNARLNDDEIAVATCLLKMKDYLNTGEECYSLKEALQDTYISLLMDVAIKNPNHEIKSSKQIWSK